MTQTERVIPQRILVTGGAGFIGSHTVDLLLAEDREVVVLDNLSSGKLHHLNLSHPNLEFVEGDVLEFPLVEDLLKNCDAVLHLAAIASVPRSIEEPIYTFQVNTQGFLHVLEATRRVTRPIRLVYASSAAVYGDVKRLPCHDMEALTSPPLSPYALQKLHDEDYAKLYSALHGIQSLALRYFNVYGERQDPHSPYSGVISRFIENYLNDADITVFGDGEQSRDFIAVQDIAKANWLALQGRFSGALNIATGKAETLLQLIGHIEAAGKRPAKVQHQPERPGDIRASFAVVATALEHIGFSSSISLQDGIAKLLAYFSDEK